MNKSEFMRVKNFIYAGLDFIFDHKYRPWFLEANAAPGGAIDYLDVYGKNKILEKLANFMNRFENPCVLVGRGSSGSKWTADQLKKYTLVNLCPYKKNMNRKSTLIDRNGRIIHPGCIFRFNFRLSSAFERSGVAVINPNCVRETAKNKYHTIAIAKKAGLRIPETHIIRNNKELKKLISGSHIYDHGYVIKPVVGSKGQGVHVFSENERIFIVHHKELLEERIIPRLIHRKYWDTRIFVINGEVVGGIMRESIHRITNLSRGAKPEKLSEMLLRKVKKPSLRIVKAIDKEAERLK